MRSDTSRLRGLAERIIELSEKGLSYRQIQKELGCSKSTIAYHLGKGQKDKAKARRQKQRDNDKRYESNRWQVTGKINPRFPLGKTGINKVEKRVKKVA